VTRFAIKVLDEADHARQAEPATTSRLRREIEALAIREASLRSLQKTIAEVGQGIDVAPWLWADADPFSS
jgi:hypothetical protein